MTKAEFNAIVNRIREAKVALLDVDSYLYPDAVTDLAGDQARQLVHELDMLRTIAMNTRTRCQNRAAQEDTSTTAEQRKLAVLYNRARVR